MTSSTTCVMCGTAATGNEETASVPCNVRRFKDESFAVWRCAGCGTIHARDEVDLAHYYGGYPFHEMAIDWRVHAMYTNMLHRLKGAGVTKSHAILDYGCGGGTLVKFLREEGYDAVGYDEFSERFRDPSTLQRQYDVVIAQDVIEHVANPWDLAATFHGLTKTGSVIVLGTPNADACDLKTPGMYKHALHQPYHRHVLSERALLSVGEKQGWALHRYYPTMYANTPFPFVNSRFVMHYLACFDDTLDVAFDGIRINSWKLYSPMTIVYALLGYFMPPRTDGMAIFKRPLALPG